ncbi:MAG: hypothetical protein WDA75_22330 [Candidatus Latescibacterota bacterium]|jgi:hypothetical protein
MTSRYRLADRFTLTGLLLVLWGAAGSWAASPPLKATVIDRAGVQHQVDRFVVQDRLDLEYYVAGHRRIVPLREIDRFRYEGDRGDEEQTVIVILRSGKQETGVALTGSNMAPHGDASGSGAGISRLTGMTPLGPFSILTSEVREVILRHPESEPPPAARVLKATVVAVDGKRFELEEVRFRGSERLEYNLGRKPRFVDLTKVSVIDFDDVGPGVEERPVTILLWSGRTIQGTVDASTVRLGGENDRNYFERVNAAFTGRGAAGAFGIGAHAVKQVRFQAVEEPAKPPAAPEAAAPADSSAATPSAAGAAPPDSSTPAQQ